MDVEDESEIGPASVQNDALLVVLRGEGLDGLAVHSCGFGGGEGNARLALGASRLRFRHGFGFSGESFQLIEKRDGGCHNDLSALLILVYWVLRGQY